MDVLRRCSQDLSMQEWTKVKTLKFLKLYSSERLLWDLSHKHNKIKRKVLEAWKRISANLDNTQIVELKKRKKNLMTRYRSLVKKKETDSEAGYDEEVYQPVWYAFEVMDSFLGSSHEDPLKIESEKNTETQTVPGIDKPKKEVETIDIDNSHHAEVKRRNDNSDNESTQTESNRSHNADMSNCSSNHNYDMSNHVYEDDDECELYARLLAKKLKRYPVETRHRLMYTIDGLLLDNPYPKDRIIK